MGAALERELKVEVDDSFHVPDLSASIGVSIVSLPEVSLEATYYDTATYRLGRWGATLRHRTSSAGSQTWTLKLPAAAPSDGPDAVPSSTLDRDEIDFDGPADKIPADAMELLRSYLREDVVAPVAVLKTRRRRNLIMSATDTLAEMDDDYVEYQVPGGRAGSFRELEVELSASGPVPILRRIRDVLVSAGVSETAALPKVFRAIGGAPQPAVPPVPAKWDRSLSTAALVSTVLARSVGRLLRDDPRVRLGEDPNALTRWRVELARLEVALADTNQVLDPAWYEEVGAGLEQLRAQVEPLAELDTVLGRLTVGASRLLPEDQSAATELVDILASQRKSHHEPLGDHLDSPAYLDLVDRLVAAAGDAPIRRGRFRPAVMTVERAVRGRLDRLTRCAADVVGKGSHPALRDRGDDRGDDLDALARATTEARASAELATHLAGGRAAKLHRALAELDGWVAELGSATAAQRWLRDTGSDLEGRLALAAGQLLAGETNRANRARRHAAPAWKAVRRRAQKWPTTR